MANNVRVIATTLVPMASDTTNAMSRTRIELTPWDLQLLLLDPIQKGVLLRKPEPQHQLEKNINLIDHLKNSLSRTLAYFPPLAGRLGTNIVNHDMTCYFIECNNAGVEFTHATAPDLSVSDILEANHIPEIVSSFFPLNGMLNCQGVRRPLLGAQVTELADGYFISCTANHAVMDGTSFWHFFNSWSEISRGLDKILKIPVFDRCFPSKPDNFDLPIVFPTFEKCPLLDPVPHPLLEQFFHFSKESVAKLKAKANSEAGSDKISSLQALSAHLWRGVTRCRCRGNGEVSLHLLVGARARIPLPEGYFGNAVYVGETGISEAELLQSGLGHAAMKINDLVSQQTGESARKFVEDWVKAPVIISRGGKSFVISSSPRHNVYGNDFGWGKPIAVRSGKGQKSDGKMTLFPGAEEGGVDVEVCLAPETLRALQDDEEFMEIFTN